MIYDKQKQEAETLSNHKEFHKVIKAICDREFVLSSANPLGHITALQNKIEVFIKTEQRLRHKGNDQRIRDGEFAYEWLNQKFSVLIDSGFTWK